MIQEVLGHTHLSMTAGYVQVGVVEMREALGALDRERPASHRVRFGRAVQSRLFAGWAFEDVSRSAGGVAEADYTGRSRSVA